MRASTIGLWTKHGLPRPDYFIGMHTAPVPVGVVMSSGGPKMAGTDQLDVLFKGVGGHGSTPQLTKDPVLMAAFAVAQYQAIVSRVIDPQQTGVLTVGSIQAGVEKKIFSLDGDATSQLQPAKLFVFGMNKR